MNAFAPLRSAHSLIGAVLRRHSLQNAPAIMGGLVAHLRGQVGRDPDARDWVDTLPSEMDPPTVSGPLAETDIHGLQARVLIDPEVFRVLFAR
jgi:hypothetical protein